MSLTLEKRRVETSAGPMAYVEVGEGKPVILLHGFPTSSYLWRNLCPLLAPWFRVLAPDLIGYGDSVKPADRPLDAAAQAGYVGDLLDASGVEEFAVVGHGMGGGIAQLLALNRDVRAAVLVDSFGFDGATLEAAEDPFALGENAPTPVGARGFLRAGFEAGMAHRARLSEEDLREYERPFSGPDGAAAYARLAGAFRSAGLAGFAGREAELAARAVPILMFWGEDDPFLPARLGERLHDALPTSSFATLPGCSHFLPEDAPETIGPMIYEWLRTKYDGRSSHAHGSADDGSTMITIGRRPPEPPPVGFEDLEDEEEE